MLSGLCRLLLLALLAVFSFNAGAELKLQEFGIVLMHGKWGMPGSHVGSLGGALRSAGAIVVGPEMPWSKSRMLDATYEQAMEEIDRAVARLKSRGARKIVIVGHSFGANAAIGYAARRDALAGVAAIAPGHVPERPVFCKLTAASVERARQLVAAGKGAEAAIFSDVNSGKTSDIRVTAQVYLSFYDPDGPAPMPKNAVAMKPVPFLWVIGRSDPLFAAGPDYVFNRAPGHSKNKYLEVDARHENTPDIAKSEVIAWLMSL